MWAKLRGIRTTSKEIRVPCFGVVFKGNQKATEAYHVGSLFGGTFKGANQP